VRVSQRIRIETALIDLIEAKIRPQSDRAEARHQWTIACFEILVCPRHQGPPRIRPRASGTDLALGGSPTRYATDCRAARSEARRLDEAMPAASGN